jgi:hypothetical protein
LMLGFPHKELPNIVECAAMQMDRIRCDWWDAPTLSKIRS